MKQHIVVQSDTLIFALTEALTYAGSSEWHLYIDEAGIIDVRHIDHDNSEWTKLVDLSKLSTNS